MSTKGKRRALMRAEKKRRKAERFKRGGAGQSRYARKQRGEIEPVYSTRCVWPDVAALFADDAARRAKAEAEWTA